MNFLMVFCRIFLVLMNRGGGAHFAVLLLCFGILDPLMSCGFVPAYYLGRGAKGQARDSNLNSYCFSRWISISTHN